MRKRLPELFIALFVLAAGVVIVVAWVPLGNNTAEPVTSPSSLVVQGRDAGPLADPEGVLVTMAANQAAEQAAALEVIAAHDAAHHFEAAAAELANKQRAAATPRPTPAPSRSTTPAPSSGTSSGGGSVWDRIAACESGGNWSINTGNGFSGGVQFAASSWAGFGGREFAPAAWQASREQQIVVAERILASQGWGAWPACSSKLGLR